MALILPTRITKFVGPRFGFLSNFYIHPITFLGVTYPSLEHAYQAAKTLDLEQRRIILAAPTPGQAKYLGSPRGIVTLRPDWMKIRDQIMRDLEEQKYPSALQTAHPGWDLTARLLDTGEAELVEGNTWHDNYWGDCICPRCKKILGGNKLGYMLMEIRDLRRQGL